MAETLLDCMPQALSAKATLHKYKRQNECEIQALQPCMAHLVQSFVPDRSLKTSAVQWFRVLP